MLFVQGYTAAMLAVDAYELFSLWTSSPLSLSQGSHLFDKRADAPLSVVLYTALLLALMLPRVFVIIEPLNRWLLMLETIHCALRVALHSALFSVNDDASQLNTMLITFALWNVVFYGRTYYTTMVMLREHSK